MIELDALNDRRKLLSILFCTIVLFYCAATLFMPSAPISVYKITENHGFSGIPGAIFLLVGAAAAPLAARLMSKYGRLNILKLAISIGILGSVTSYIGELHHSLNLFLLGLAFLGIAGAVIVLSRVMIMEMFPLKDQPKVMGYVFLGAVVGGITGPVIGHMSNGMTTDSNILAWKASAVLFSTALFLSFIPKRDSLAIAAKLSNQISSTTSIPSSTKAANRRLVMIVISIGASGHSLMVALMSIAGALMKMKDIELSLIYLAMGLHFIGMFGTMPISARLYSKIGFDKTVYLAILLYLSSVSFLIIANTALYYILCLLLLGAGWSLCFLSATMRISSLVNMDKKVHFVAKNDLYSALGGAALTLIAGLALQYLGQIGVAYVMLAILIVMLGCVIASSKNSETII